MQAGTIINYYRAVDDHKIAGAIRTERCYYCNCMMYQRGTAGALAYPRQIASTDHYVPYSITCGLLAPLDGDKRVRSCERCNSLKADKPADIFEYFVRQNDMRQPERNLRQAFTRFSYMLMSVGYIATMREAMDHKRDARNLA